MIEPSADALVKKKCVPCEGGTLPMTEQEAKKMLRAVRGWELVEGKKIKKEFSFKTYLDGVDFAAKVANLAESEGHHPKIVIDWRKVRIELMTHAIAGLSENDFILAAKIERLF